jgi:hypothetical protein
MLLILPCSAVALLIYHAGQAIKARKLEREILALINSGIRASDLEQWRSLDC